METRARIPAAAPLLPVIFPAGAADYALLQVRFLKKNAPGKADLRRLCERVCRGRCCAASGWQAPPLLGQIISPFRWAASSNVTIYSFQGRVVVWLHAGARLQACYECEDKAALVSVCSWGFKWAHAVRGDVASRAAALHGNGRGAFEAQTWCAAALGLGGGLGGGGGGALWGGGRVRRACSEQLR